MEVSFLNSSDDTSPSTSTPVVKPKASSKVTPHPQNDDMLAKVTFFNA